MRGRNPSLPGAHRPTQAHDETDSAVNLGISVKRLLALVDEAEQIQKGTRRKKESDDIGQILVVSDDAEFVRALSACWRKENHSLSMTAVSTRVGGQADSSGYLLVVVGPLREGVAFPSSLSLLLDSTVCAVGDTGSLASVRAKHADCSWFLNIRDGQRLCFPCAGGVAPDRCGRARAAKQNSGIARTRDLAFWADPCWKHGREWSTR